MGAALVPPLHQRKHAKCCNCWWHGSSDCCYLIGSSAGCCIGVLQLGMLHTEDAIPPQKNGKRRLCPNKKRTPDKMWEVWPIVAPSMRHPHEYFKNPSRPGLSFGCGLPDVVCVVTSDLTPRRLNGRCCAIFSFSAAYARWIEINTADC